MSNRFEVPAIIEETGLSGHYLTQFTELCSAIEEDNEIDKPLNRRKYDQLQTYRGRFSRIEYENVVTDKNRTGIDMLDKLVLGINSLLGPKKRKSLDDVFDLCAQAESIITGR